MSWSGSTLLYLESSLFFPAHKETSHSFCHLLFSSYPLMHICVFYCIEFLSLSWLFFVPLLSDLHSSQAKTVYVLAPDLPKCWNFMSLSLPCRMCPNQPCHNIFSAGLSTTHRFGILSRAELWLTYLLLSPHSGHFLNTTVSVFEHHHEADGIENLLEIEGACFAYGAQLAISAQPRVC